jgi:PKHD-type hydroxylase
MVFNPHLDTFQRGFIVYPKQYDDKTLQILEEYCKSLPYNFDDGSFNTPNPPDQFRTSTTIKHFPQSLKNFEFLTHSLISNVNNTFKFDINNIHYIYAEYLKHSSHLEWHSDINGFPSNTRKISFSINVNDTNEYEGGDLEFNTGDIEVVKQDKGNIVFFPSFLLHRVTPVTKGIRKVIIGFITGPPYK